MNIISDDVSSPTSDSTLPQTYGYSNYDYDEFNTAMNNNPIDSSEHESLPISGNTYDLVQHYGKYIEVWENEINFSIENLKNLITPEQYALLSSAQKVWKEANEETMQFDINALGNSLGREFQFSYLHRTLEAYRERAIHIKYLTFIIETIQEDPIPAENQTWNQFSVSQ